MRLSLTFSYTNGSFTDCEADAAYPPGLYPQSNGSTSTFAQRYTGTYSADGGSIGTFTIGQTVTPQTPFSTPASSMCTTYTSVGNGIALESLGVSGTIATVAGASGSNMASGSSGSMSMSGSMSSMTGSARMSGSGASGSAGSAASGASGAAQSAGASGSSNSAAGMGIAFGPVVAGLITVGAVFAGVGAVVL